MHWLVQYIAQEDVSTAVQTNMKNVDAQIDYNSSYSH